MNHELLRPSHMHRPSRLNPQSYAEEPPHPHPYLSVAAAPGTDFTAAPPVYLVVLLDLFSNVGAVFPAFAQPFLGRCVLQRRVDGTCDDALEDARADEYAWCDLPVE